MPARLTAAFDDWRGIEDDGLRAIITREFSEQFAPYPLDRVMSAASVWISKNHKFPAVSQLLELIRANAPSPIDAERWKPPSGPSEGYRAWRDKDRELTREAAEKAKKLPPELGSAKFAKGMF